MTASDSPPKVFNGPNICTQCGQTGVECGRRLQVCAGCHRRHCCSRACQSADWRAGHRVVCADLQRQMAETALIDRRFLTLRDDSTTWVRRSQPHMMALAVRCLYPLDGSLEHRDTHMLSFNVRYHREGVYFRVDNFACVPIADAQQYLDDASMPPSVPHYRNVVRHLSERRP